MISKNIFLVMLLCAATIAQSQVWTLPAKEFYAQLSYSRLHYSSAYDSTGEIDQLIYIVWDRTIQLNAEYGLTDKLTAIAKLPYKMVQAELLFNVDPFNSEPDKLNYFGNIEFGAVYKLKKAQPYINASLIAEANTSDYNFITKLQTGFNSWGFKPGIAIAESYVKGWYSIYVSADLRTNNYSHSINGNAEAGYKPVKFLFIAGNLFTRNSFKNGNYCDCTIRETSLYLNDQAYLAGGLKLGLIIKEFGINLGYTTAITAKNAPGKPVITAGISYKSIKELSDREGQ